MPSKKQSANSQPQAKFHRSPEFKSIYVNWMQGSFGPFDIALAVGQARATSPTSMEVEHEANIIFSPLEAKIAVAMLGNLIKVYEANFGEVKIPKGMEGQFAEKFPTVPSPE